jgi:anthranilate synthase component 2
VQEVIHTLDSKIYKQVPSDIKVGLYHSWAVDISRAKELIPTAFSEGNVLMSMEHKQYPIVGVQFHPESIMTEFGMKIIENFIESY